MVLARRVPSAQPHLAPPAPRALVTCSGVAFERNVWCTTTSSNLLKKVNRVTFTELFDDDTMMLKRFQFELLRVLRANPRGNGRKARAARDT